MPIPNPKGKKKKEKFLSNCMGDSVMVKEFSNNKQRYAVSQSKWKNAKKKSNGEETWEPEDNSEVILY